MKIESKESFNPITIVLESQEEVDEMFAMKNCCDKPSWKDLTQGLGEERHYYCSRCRAHIWRGRFWTYETWKNWINSEDVD